MGSRSRDYGRKKKEEGGRKGRGKKEREERRGYGGRKRGRWRKGGMRKGALGEEIRYTKTNCGGSVTIDVFVTHSDCRCKRVVFWLGASLLSGIVS